MEKLLQQQFPEAEAFIVSNPADIFYLTGFFCNDSLLLYGAEPVLVTDSRYALAAKSAKAEVSIVSGPYLSGLIDVARKKGYRTLGIQEEYLTAQQYLALREEKFSLVPTHGIFCSLRAAKNEGEIKAIRAAQAVTDSAFEKLLPFIHEGVTEKQLRARLEFLLFACGADGLAFDTIVAGGPNGALPHAVPSDRPIQKGEFITFDFGARVGGYCSDMTRTVALGAIDARQKEIYEAVDKAHEAGAALLKPGISACAADEAARKVLAEAGLGKYFTHSLGHGVGIEIHEQPRLSPKSEDILVPGHVVTVEPGVYIEEFCGVRTENMYVISCSGHENLTGTDKKLIKL